MSAIQMICPDCGARYLAGVVGTTPWPAHVCPKGTVSGPPSPAAVKDNP
jgi:hypothetical protein